MKSYINKFRLDGKVACVLGGVGLIGSEITKALSDAGAKTLILDVNEKEGIKLVKEINNDQNDAEFMYFNVTDLEKITEDLNQINEKFNQIDIFINCSYPRTEDWEKCTFKQITLDSFRKNVDLHMNSYVWSAREAAELMSKQDNGGSIVLLGSTYRVLEGRKARNQVN